MWPDLSCFLPTSCTGFLRDVYDSSKRDSGDHPEDETAQQVFLGKLGLVKQDFEASTSWTAIAYTKLHIGQHYGAVAK